ncbi:MAG TPA: serine hydrolase domain-containing protein [Thermomicrobiales bacterium]|nr:serine hydrolase domain-containing protein [Thermomicrobiales bacterium]
MDARRFDGLTRMLAAPRSRRRAMQVAAAAAAASRLRPAQAAPATPAATPVAGDAADRVVAITRQAIASYGLNAAIVRVTIDGQELLTEAFGESMTGVPATTAMHFRNGAVAFSYLATLLLQFVDRKRIALDDPLAKWEPTLPAADKITLRMIVTMTSGYFDYVQNQDLVSQLYVDPFRQWTPEELIGFGIDKPLMFEPGTNWGYSHTNFVILGQVLEKVGGKPLAELMQTNIFDPLGLTGTAGGSTAAIPEPALHAFTSERREALGIKPDVPFLEESTYWNPSWTTAAGAIQTTTIHDLTTTAIAVGTGALLSPESHQLQVAPTLRGFGKPVAGCPTCFTQDERYTYGLGVILSGNWLLQNPLYYGYAAVEGYLPAKKLAIATSVTFTEASFDAQGSYKPHNAAQSLFTSIANGLAPDDPVPA